MAKEVEESVIERITRENSQRRRCLACNLLILDLGRHASIVHDHEPDGVEGWERFYAELERAE